MCVQYADLHKLSHYSYAFGSLFKHAVLRFF